MYTMRSTIPFSIWITDNDTNPTDKVIFNALRETKGTGKRMRHRGKVKKKTKGGVV